MPIVDWKWIWGKAGGGVSTPGERGKRGMAMWDKAPVTECQSISHHHPLLHMPHCVISPLVLGTETNPHIFRFLEMSCIWGGKEGSVPDDFISKAPMVVVFGSSHAVEAQPR